MTLLLDVISEITLPIVLMIGLGLVLQKRVGLDVRSMNRLVIYGTLPSLLVVSLAQADMPIFEVQAVVFFTLGQFFVFLAIGWGVAALFRLDAEARPVVALAIAFFNSGNFGIPLIELAFGPLYVPHQAVITAVLTILILAVGPVVLTASASGLRGSLVSAFRTPLLPAVFLGLALNMLGVSLPRVIGYPLELVAGANTPAALIALGAQLGVGGWAVSRLSVGLGVGLRLVLGPLLTWAALILLGLPEGMNDLLLVGAATPVGILLAIFCMEYRGEAKLASAIVAISTALSPLAVTALVYLARAG